MMRTALLKAKDAGALLICLRTAMFGVIMFAAWILAEKLEDRVLDRTC
jgi:hypothetical protein